MEDWKSQALKVYRDEQESQQKALALRIEAEYLASKNAANGTLNKAMRACGLPHTVALSEMKKISVHWGKDGHLYHLPSMEWGVLLDGVWFSVNSDNWVHLAAPCPKCGELQRPKRDFCITSMRDIGINLTDGFVCNNPVHREDNPFSFGESKEGT